MIVSLIFIIVLNCCVICFLFVKNDKSKLIHFRKTEALRAIIIELLNHENEKKEKIRLAEELKQKLKDSNTKLNADILALQYEFVDTLTKNNLLQ